MKRLKIRKAPGICGIVVVDWMAKVFNMVWQEGVAPGDWRYAVIVPVYKKGSRLDGTN